MRIDAYIGNPIIVTQQDYYQLEELLQEIDPQFNSVQLRQELVVIENIARRTFRYPRYPTIRWVADRLSSMVEKGL